MHKLLQTRTATLIQTLSFIHIKSHAAFINTRPLHTPWSPTSDMFQSSVHDCTQEITGIYLPLPTVQGWCHWLRYSLRTEERLWKPRQLRFSVQGPCQAGVPRLLSVRGWSGLGLLRISSSFRASLSTDIKWWGGNVIKPALDLIVKQPRWKSVWQTTKALFNKNTHPIF